MASLYSILTSVSNVRFCTVFKEASTRRAQLHQFLAQSERSRMGHHRLLSLFKNRIRFVEIRVRNGIIPD